MARAGTRTPAAAADDRGDGPQGGAWPGFPVALVLTAVAVAVTLWLAPRLGTYMVSVFLAAVALSAWFGGLAPALLSLVLSTVALAYLATLPAEVQAAQRTTDLVRISTFSATALLLTVMSHRLQQALAEAKRHAVRARAEIEERRAAEAARRASEARLGAIVDSATDAIITSDAGGRIVLFNKGAERMFGVPAVEATGTSLDRFIPARLRERHAAHMRRLDATGAASQDMHGVLGALPALRADGSEFPVEATIARIQVDGDTLFTAVLRDVTERVAAEAQRRSLAERERQAERAEAARVHAEAANRAKSEFLASMSHELRTPLGAILGYTELLDEQLVGPLTERQRTYLQRVHASASHLLTLVNDALDLAKVEAGRLLVHPEEASAPVAVEAAIALVQPQAVTRGISLRFAGADAPRVRYLGDPRRVKQILVNLLANAVKLTDDGGSIDVECALADAPDPAACVPPGGAGWCFIRVADTGRGIASTRLATIFEAFVQLDGGTGRSDDPGTGLGLSISRDLARLMDGDITVHSESGVGSVFTLWLPAVPTVTVSGGGAPAAPAAIRDRRGPARFARGLAAVGDTVLHDLDGVIQRYTARVRVDPSIPAAAQASDTEIGDHMTTLLSDAAQSLGVIEALGGAPSQVLRDGSEIQRLIADRHGLLRYRLGWTEAGLDRDYDILRDEVEAAAKGTRDHDPHAPVEAALAILLRALERARAVSRQSFRLADDGGGAQAG